MRGLSPRARGNPRAAHSGEADRGSIPACTGEPSGSLPARSWRPVYPRVHGGTRTTTHEPDTYDGLSPRARGNQVSVVRRGRGQRSIPACTGEPARRPSRRSRSRVYPRVHGGTFRPSALPFFRDGLSPRARGNHRGHHPPPPRRGSIPACTGEPGAGSAATR